MLDQRQIESLPTSSKTLFNFDEYAEIEAQKRLEEIKKDVAKKLLSSFAKESAHLSFGEFTDTIQNNGRNTYQVLRSMPLSDIAAAVAEAKFEKINTLMQELSARENLKPKQIESKPLKSRVKNKKACVSVDELFTMKNRIKSYMKSVLDGKAANYIRRIIHIDENNLKEIRVFTAALRELTKDGIFQRSGAGVSTRYTYCNL